MSAKVPETTRCSGLWVSDVSGLLQRCVCCGTFAAEPAHTDDCHLKDIISRAETVAWLRAEADAMEHSPVCNNFGPMPMTCCGHCPVGIVRRLADALEAGDGGE